MVTYRSVTPTEIATVRKNLGWVAAWGILLGIRAVTAEAAEHDWWGLVGESILTMFLVVACVAGRVVLKGKPVVLPGRSNHGE